MSTFLTKHKKFNSFFFFFCKKIRERTKSLEEELHKVKAARSVDDLQRKELEDQLEAEQYFTTLYKTQVRELTDEVDEAKERQVRRMP